MRSVAKHSYVKGSSGKSRIKAHIDYIQHRSGLDKDEQKRLFFNDSRDGIEGREIKQDFEDMKYNPVVAHKLMLSPGCDGVDMKKYTREVLRELGNEKGLDLDWYSVEHKNTDHDHTHVVVKGLDKEGHRVRFNIDDYKKLRELGDDYLERHHFYERYLDKEIHQLLKEPDYRLRGDDEFNKIFSEHNRDFSEPAKEKGLEKKEPEPFDLDKAISKLPANEKIEANGQLYTKFSPLDDLKELDEHLKEDYSHHIDYEDYKTLWTWIGTKEKAGDDYYKKKEQDPFRDDEEWRRLDEDFKKYFRDMNQSTQLYGKGFDQVVREQQGRLSAEHGHYVNAMEIQRLEHLAQRFPEREEHIQELIADVRKYDVEQWRDERGYDDLDKLLGEDKTDKELGKDVKQEQTIEPGQSAMEQILEHRQVDEMTQPTEEQERQMDDDAFGRGER